MARVQWQCNGIGWQRFIHNRQQNLPFHCVPTGQNKLSTSCQNFATQCKLSARWCFTINVCKNVHFARLCIGHLVQPLSFRTTDVPASQWSRTWHHPGDGATLTLHCILQILHSTLYCAGKWSSTKENSFVERSFIMGFSQAGPRSVSQGNFLQRETSSKISCLTSLA